MPATKKAVKEQVDRLMLLPGKDVHGLEASGDDPGSMVQVLRNELGRTMQLVAKDDSHCLRIAESLMAGRFRPLACDIREAADATRQDDVPSGCSICEGQPWVSFTKGLYDYAARCSCLRGECLKSKDRERRGAGA